MFQAYVQLFYLKYPLEIEDRQRLREPRKSASTDIHRTIVGGCGHLRHF